MTTRDYVIAITAGLPSIVVAVLTYRRSTKVDSVAAQAGIATESRAGTAQIIEGLNGLIDNLQEDNVAFRDEVRYLTGRMTELIAEGDACRRKLNDLHRRYGENGSEEVR